MQIEISYDSSTSFAPLGFTGIVDQAVQFLEQTFINPITITIQVGWGEIGGTRLPLGVTGEGGPRSGTLYTYNQVKTALANNINSAADATAVANLPTTDPTRGGSFYIGAAEKKALGLLSANASGVDGAVGFQGDVGVATVEHEITHAMGRIAFLGSSGNFNEFSVLDLFRYTGAGILNPTGASGAYFSADGGRTAINIFDSTSDPGDWAGATPDAFNAFGGPNDPVTPGDIEVMNILGFASAAPTVQGRVITLGATPQTVTGAPGDTIIGGSGSAVINATAGAISVVGGSGSTSVFGGVGDMVTAGSGNTYIDGTLGGMAIAVGSAGTDTIIGAIAKAAGAGVDTLTGGAGAVRIEGLGQGDIVNFAGQTGNATINATSGNIAVTLGSGAATVYGGAGDTVNLGSGDQYVDGLAGGSRIAVGSAGGFDILIGSMARAAGAGVDTLTGGAAFAQIQGLGRGDVVNFAAQTGNASINATAGNIAVTLGAGAASVYGGAGDTINLGSVSQYVDARQGGATTGGGAGAIITLGTGGTDNIIGSTVPGAGVTIKGGAATLNYNPGIGNDLIDLTGTSGRATINAFGFDNGPVNDTIIAGNGNVSVWGGQGDRIGVGSGASGSDLFTHATMINGASIAFGTSNAVVAASYGAAPGAVTVNSALAGASSARVTVNGFAETGGAPTDSIFYQNETAGRNASIVATSTQVSVDGAASTQFTLPDGTVMTLFGVPNADFNTSFFKH